MAQSAGAAEFTDCISAEGLDPPNFCSRYDTKQSDGLGFSNAGALGNVEYLSIAIVLRSTLTWTGSTIYGWNRIKLCDYAKLNFLK